MQSDSPSANGAPHEGALPPVEPPSARFILQLFLVPLLLVGVFGAVIYFLFGWIGLGSSDPYKLMDDLESGASEKVRWKAAQDLAQILPRDESLQMDVAAALRLAAILSKEMQIPPPEDKDQLDFLKFLPAAIANFRPPVGLPLLLEIVSTYVDKQADEGDRERLYNGLHALAVMGDNLQAFDRLSADQQQGLLTALQGEAQDTSVRSARAKAAYEYLSRRAAHDTKQSKEPLPDVAGIIPVLTRAARCPDEMARKYTLLALVHSREAGAEQLLRELAGPNDDIIEFVNNDKERGKRELRQNAALALARRGSPLTPWHIVLDTLDEESLRKRVDERNDELATRTLLKALGDLHALKAEMPAVYAEQKDIHEAVSRLGGSSTAIVQVEARKLLGGAPDAVGKGPVVSREFLLLVTFGGAIVFLLALAVFARWKRKTAPVA